LIRVVKGRSGRGEDDVPLRVAPVFGVGRGRLLRRCELADPWSEGGITLASNMTLSCAASPDLPAQIATATATSPTDRKPSPGTGRVAAIKPRVGAFADASAMPA
jgi:hypothetical protein